MPLSLPPPPPPHGDAGGQLLDGATAAINDGTFTELVMQVTDAGSATSEATQYVGATSGEATQYVGATSGEATQYVGATSGEVTQYVRATTGEVMAGEQSYEVYDANSGLYRVSLVVDCVA